MSHRINLDRLKDMIQFGSYIYSLINGKGDFIEEFVSDYKGMRKQKNTDEEIE